MVRISHNYGFNFNNNVLVTLKIQIWIDDCIDRFDDPKLLEVVWINCKDIKKIIILMKNIIIRVRYFG
jgi:hypothetical protein